MGAWLIPTPYSLIPTPAQPRALYFTELRNAIICDYLIFCAKSGSFGLEVVAKNSCGSSSPELAL